MKRKEINPTLMGFSFLFPAFDPKPIKIFLHLRNNIQHFSALLFFSLPLTSLHRIRITFESDYLPCHGVDKIETFNSRQQWSDKRTRSKCFVVVQIEMFEERECAIKLQVIKINLDKKALDQMTLSSMNPRLRCYQKHFLFASILF